MTDCVTWFDDLIMFDYVQVLLALMVSPERWVPLVTLVHLDQPVLQDQLDLVVCVIFSCLLVTCISRML